MNVLFITVFPLNEFNHFIGYFFLLTPNFLETIFLIKRLPFRIHDLNMELYFLCTLKMLNDIFEE